MKISSKENPVIKYLIKIFESKKERDISGVYIVEGYHLVEEANKAHVLKHVYSINEEKEYPDSVILTSDLMKKITNTITPQGIIGLVEKRENDVVGKKVLYLDRVQDPGNIGTLLRSALCFNFDTVVLDDCCDIYNPKVVRASEGALFNLNFPKITLEKLKETHKIISTSMFGKDVSEFDFSKEDNIVIVLGNEGSGVKEEYQSLADEILTIPMNKVESLNVGVAGSILMYESEKK